MNRCIKWTIQHTWLLSKVNDQNHRTFFYFPKNRDLTLFINSRFTIYRVITTHNPLQNYNSSPIKPVSKWMIGKLLIFDKWLLFCYKGRRVSRSLIMIHNDIYYGFVFCNQAEPVQFITGYYIVIHFRIMHRVLYA